jgi:hypothetical protein
MGILSLIDTRRTIRAESNPLDKSTVVSIYPRELVERKPTIQPGIFTIPAGSIEKPTLVVVGPSSWWRDIDIEQPLLEIVNGSVQVANSIVVDYCNGLLGCNMRDTMPGLFWVPGEFKTVESLFKAENGAHKKKFDIAVANQERYWKALVKIGDIGWNKTNGNPLTISDDMRLAARMLNLENSKPWMKDIMTMALVHCVACGALRNPDYPVCGSCKAIVDPEKAKSLGLTFAQ